MNEEKKPFRVSEGGHRKSFQIENERLYSINETAKICGISRSTLLRMEEYGFDRARYVDPDNGYHYYDVVNIHRIMSYQMMQKLGISARDITAYYRHELDPEAFLEKLRDRLAVAQRCVDEFESRLSERESCEFSFFTLPEVNCWCFPCEIRDPKKQIGYNYAKLQEMYGSGYKPFPTTPMFSITPEPDAVYDESNAKSGNSLICVAIYPDEKQPADQVMHFKTRQAFSMLYHGNSSEMMSSGGEILLREMRKQGLTPAGPLYGICVVGPFFGTDIDPRDYVFRWAIPI